MKTCRNLEKAVYYRLKGIYTWGYIIKKVTLIVSIILCFLTMSILDAYPGNITRSIKLIVHIKPELGINIDASKIDKNTVSLDSKEILNGSNLKGENVKLDRRLEKGVDTLVLTKFFL